MAKRKTEIAATDDTTPDVWESIRDLGKEIRRRRVRQNLTAKEVSQQLGITATSLNHLELGINLPGIPRLKTITDHFGLEWEPVKQLVIEIKMQRARDKADCL